MNLFYRKMLLLTHPLHRKIVGGLGLCMIKTLNNPDAGKQHQEQHNQQAQTNQAKQPWHKPL